MKRLLVLLIVLAGGVAAAALTIPTNAAVVNGSSISQQTLNSDVNAIASSIPYQCYLNSQAYLASGGSSQQLPPVTGAGTGQNAGDHPTANNAFVSTYLSTEIGHQIIFEVADAHHVTVTPTELADARTNLSTQISQVMSQILQTSAGQDPRYSCTATGQPVSGEQVLSTLPTSFVDQQVEFVATASALQEDLAGVGSSEADLQRYFEQHRAQFDTACFTAAVYTDQAAAQDAAAAAAFGTPFAQLAKGASQTGQLQCGVLADFATQLPASAKLDSLAVGGVAGPVNVNGGYYLLELTKRTPTPFATAKSAVAQAAQAAGASATQKALTAAERRSAVSVDPRYGVWVPATASVFTPFTPNTSDVLNSSANQPGATPASAASPSNG